MKMKSIIVVFCLFCTCMASANARLDKKEKRVTITYEKYRNGKLIPHEEILINCARGWAHLSNPSQTERFFIDYNSKSVVKLLDIDSTQYKQARPFTELARAKDSDETKNILGYQCKKASFVIFSNRIDVWYTTQTTFKASPSLSAIIDNGLILKYVANGNYTILAKSIDKNKGFMPYPDDKVSEINEAAYRELLINSRFVSIPVFDKEQINFQADLCNPKEELYNHTYHFSKGTVIMKKIKLPKHSQGGYWFAKLTNWSNGDAYDRTGCVFTLASDKKQSLLDGLQNGLKTLPLYFDKEGKAYQGVISTDSYTVPIELMRYFTSFGVSHFNNKRPINNYNWQDSVVYKQEITDLIATDADELWLGVFIGNYDKGGHKVSLELNYYPPFEASQAKPKLIKPLFYTLNIMEASGQNYGRMFKNDSLCMTFDIEESLNKPQLLFTTTGHGGWGNGDEFVPKLNQVFIDGELVFKHVPWRSDCATYRMSNPASGNFGNGLSSSDLSRSNWCPATLTQPYYIPLDQLSPGKHQIKVIIDQGDDEGSSFNHWSVSGILIGNE